MPQLRQPLTADYLTGQLAPVGVITGFSSPHIRSAWPTPIGKPLSNRRITERAKQGYYGPLAKQAALAKTKITGFVDRCACGATLGVRFYKYKYLEKPAFLCPACLEQERLAAPAREAKEKELKRRIDITEFC